MIMQNKALLQVCTNKHPIS